MCFDAKVALDCLSRKRGIGALSEYGLLGRVALPKREYFGYPGKDRHQESRLAKPIQQNVLLNRFSGLLDTRVVTQMGYLLVVISG